MAYTEIHGTECDGCGTRWDPVKGCGKLVLCDRCITAHEEYEDYMRWIIEEEAAIREEEQNESIS